MKKLVLVICLMMQAFNAFAKDEDVRIQERKKDTVLEDSNEYSRLNKTIYLGLKSFGLEVGYYINRNNMIILESRILEKRESSGESQDHLGSRSTLRKIDAQDFSAFYKRYAGDTFYYRVGLNYADIRSYDVATENGGEEGFRLSGYRVSGSIGIGNQWQWKNFSLGIDWFTVVLPVHYSLAEDEGMGNVGISERDDEKTRWFSEPQISPLFVNLGLSF